MGWVCLVYIRSNKHLGEEQTEEISSEESLEIGGRRVGPSEGDLFGGSGEHRPVGGLRRLEDEQRV